MPSSERQKRLKTSCSFLDKDDSLPNTVNEKYKNPKTCAEHDGDQIGLKEKQFYTVMTSAIQDFDWEVKLTALEFWQTVVHKQFLAFGFDTSELPWTGVESAKELSCDSKELSCNRKDISHQGGLLLATEEATCKKEESVAVQDEWLMRSSKVFDRLVNTGCISCLVEAADDYDDSVQVRALRILRDIKELLIKYFQLQHSESTSIGTSILVEASVSEQMCSLNQNDFAKLHTVDGATDKLYKKLLNTDFSKLKTDKEEFSTGCNKSLEALLDELLQDMAMAMEEGDHGAKLTSDCY